MNNFNKIFSIFLLTSLGGCATWRINEDYFFKPLARDPVGERIEITADDGTVLVGRLLKHPQARATLVYFGGNTEYVDFSGKTLQKLAGFRLNVLMVDYRGYGASAGSPSINTFFTDGRSVLRYAQTRPDLQGLPLIVYGFSLGGYAAAYAASHEPCSALVLEATGTNVKDWTSLMLPWYYKPFVRIRIDEKLKAIDNTAGIKKFHNPLLVMGGKADSQAPAAMSQKLFYISPSANKRLHLFAVGRHGSIKEEADFPKVFSDFLENNLRCPEEDQP